MCSWALLRTLYMCKVSPSAAGEQDGVRSHGFAPDAALQRACSNEQQPQPGNWRLAASNSAHAQLPAAAAQDATSCWCRTWGNRAARSAASRQQLWVCRRTACLVTARLARGMSQARAPSLGCSHHVYLIRVCRGHQHLLDTGQTPATADAGTPSSSEVEQACSSHAPGTAMGGVGIWDHTQQELSGRNEGLEVCKVLHMCDRAAHPASHC